MGRKRSRSASSSSTSTDSAPSEAYKSKRSRRSRSTSRDRRREPSLISREPRQPLHRRHDSPRHRERSRSPAGYRNARTTYRDDSRDRRGGGSRRERSPDPRHHGNIQRNQPTINDGPPRLFSIHRYPWLLKHVSSRIASGLSTSSSVYTEQTYSPFGRLGSLWLCVATEGTEWSTVARSLTS